MYSRPLQKTLSLASKSGETPVLSQSLQKLSSDAVTALVDVSMHSLDTLKSQAHVQLMLPYEHA